MGKILLWWRFDLSEDRTSWTVLAIPVYEGTCATSVLLEAELSELLLLCWSYFCYCVLSPLPSSFPWCRLWAYFGFGCTVVLFHKVAILIGMSEAHKCTNRKQCLKCLGQLRMFGWNGGSSLEGNMRTVCWHLLHCHDQGPDLKAIFQEGNNHPSWIPRLLVE